MIKRRGYCLSCFYTQGEKMLNLYEIDDDYIEYLRGFDSKVLSSKQGNRKETRKYIGVLLHNKNYKYFIPLSSYKPETYDSMNESISFKK